MATQSRQYLTAIALLCHGASAFADGIINLLVENDVWTGTDRHYTSGVMLNYVSAIDQGPERLRKLGIRFPGIERDDRMHVALSLGHEIYTPTDITTAELLPEDRPYAGHAYIAAGFTTENPDEIETWRLSLGMVGPGVKAEYVQNALHRKLGVDEAQGWNNQLENEIVISVAYEKKWLNLAREKEFKNDFSIDFIPHFAGSLGNVITQFGVGGMVRLGKGLHHDYGPPRVRPSLPVSQFYNREEGASWYFYVGIDTRFVAYNVFLDGNLFRPSIGVDREDFVSDLQAGLVWNNDKFRIAYSYIQRSREFIQQQERDVFGSLSISVHF